MITTAHIAALMARRRRGDSLFPFVGLLVHGDALLNPSPGVFTATDSSLANRTIVQINAGAFVDTGTFKFGTGSLGFDSSIAGGGGFSGSAAATPSITPRTGEFTIEDWMYVTAATMVNGSAFCVALQFSGTRPFFFGKFPGTTQMYVQCGGGATGDLLTAPIPAFTSDAWHFMSLSRSAANVSYMHLDGTLVGTFADINDYGDTTNAFKIGPNLGSGENFHIDDLRMTLKQRHGAANYSVPTGAFPNHA